HLTDGGFAYQRCHYAALVVVIETGLHYHNKRNAVPVLATVEMNVELGHQSVEWSSANDPCFSANSFHSATVDLTTFSWDARRCVSLTRYSARSDSTTLERFAVTFRTWASKSSLSVRLTARLRASRS